MHRKRHVFSILKRNKQRNKTMKILFRCLFRFKGTRRELVEKPGTFALKLCEIDENFRHQAMIIFLGIATKFLKPHDAFRCGSPSYLHRLKVRVGLLANPRLMFCHETKTVKLLHAFIFAICSSDRPFSNSSFIAASPRPS